MTTAMSVEQGCDARVSMLFAFSQQDLLWHQSQSALITITDVYLTCLAFVTLITIVHLEM